MTACASASSSAAALTSATDLPRKRGCIHLKRHSADSSRDFTASNNASACAWYSSMLALNGSDSGLLILVGIHTQISALEAASSPHFTSVPWCVATGQPNSYQSQSHPHSVFAE